VIEPWAAIVIGIIAGIFYSCFSRLLLVLNIDDPLEAASVHYINGAWGTIACGIFDSTRGWVSGSPQSGEYFGLQIYGVVCVTVWSMVCTAAFFLPCVWLGWHKYHPVIELIGAHRIKMGEITTAFLEEIRAFGSKKVDLESSMNYANKESVEPSSSNRGGSASSRKSAKAQVVPMMKHNKIHTETEMVQIFNGGGAN
jgi:Ammonium Transporter Family